MTPEEMKLQAEALNTKMDSYEAQFKQLSDSLETVKDSFDADKIKDELKSVSEKLTEANQEYKAFTENNQKTLNELEAKLSRFSDVDTTKETFNKYLNRVVNEKADDLKNVKNNGGQTTLTLKADMTMNADYTNDVVAADRLQGVYADPLRRFHVRDLMNTSLTSSDKIYHNTESGYSDGAGTAAEGSAGTQTDFDLTQNSTLVEKLTTYLTMSVEMMEDSEFMANYLQTRVVPRLLLKEDQQLIYGTGTTPQLKGLDTNAAAWSDTLADADVSEVDVLFAGATQAQILNYAPNYHLIHPNDWQNLVLTKDDNGNYVLPAAYTAQPVVINGARVLPTTAITSGDHLTGDFAMGATFYIRRDIQVTFANQHSTDFTEGKVTILIEERVANVIHNPNAFVEGAFATSLAKGSA